MRRAFQDGRRIAGPPDEKESHPSGGQAHPFPYEQWLYRTIEGAGRNIIVDFGDPERKGEYRMTMDPAVEKATMQAMGEWPVAQAGLPRAGVTVNPGRAEAEWTIPLMAYGDRAVTIYQRVTRLDASSGSGKVVRAWPVKLARAAEVAALKQQLWLGPGSYRLDVVVKDDITNRSAVDTLEFRLK